MVRNLRIGLTWFVKAHVGFLLPFHLYRRVLWTASRVVAKVSSLVAMGADEAPPAPTLVQMPLESPRNAARALI